MARQRIHQRLSAVLEGNVITTGLVRQWVYLVGQSKFCEERPVARALNCHCTSIHQKSAALLAGDAAAQPPFHFNDGVGDALLFEFVSGCQPGEAAADDGYMRHLSPVVFVLFTKYSPYNRK